MSGGQGLTPRLRPAGGLYPQSIPRSKASSSRPLPNYRDAAVNRNKRHSTGDSQNQHAYHYHANDGSANFSPSMNSMGYLNGDSGKRGGVGDPISIPHRSPGSKHVFSPNMVSGQQRSLQYMRVDRRRMNAPSYDHPSMGANMGGGTNTGSIRTRTRVRANGRQHHHGADGSSSSRSKGHPRMQSWMVPGSAAKHNVTGKNVVPLPAPPISGLRPSPPSAVHPSEVQPPTTVDSRTTRVTQHKDMRAALQSGLGENRASSLKLKPAGGHRSIDQSSSDTNNHANMGMKYYDRHEWNSKLSMTRSDPRVSDSPAYVINDAHSSPAAAPPKQTQTSSPSSLVYLGRSRGSLNRTYADPEMSKRYDPKGLPRSASAPSSMHISDSDRQPSPSDNHISDSDRQPAPSDDHISDSDRQPLPLDNLNTQTRDEQRHISDRSSSADGSSSSLVPNVATSTTTTAQLPETEMTSFDATTADMDDVAVSQESQPTTENTTVSEQAAAPRTEGQTSRMAVLTTNDDETVAGEGGDDETVAESSVAGVGHETSDVMTSDDGCHEVSGGDARVKIEESCLNETVMATGHSTGQMNEHTVLQQHSVSGPALQPFIIPSQASPIFFESLEEAYQLAPTYEETIQEVGQSAAVPLEADHPPAIPLGVTSREEDDLVVDVNSLFADGAGSEPFEKYFMGGGCDDGAWGMAMLAKTLPQTAFAAAAASPNGDTARMSSRMSRWFKNDQSQDEIAAELS